MSRQWTPWFFAVALGVLGWYAMVPLWTQGLGLVALDADSQPALWFAAARALLVLGGGILIFRTIVTFNEKSRLKPLIRNGLVLGLGLYLAALVLLLAMGGQPIRLWFLLTQWDWGNPVCRGILGYAVCLLTFFGVHQTGIFKYVIALSGVIGFILLALQLSANLSFTNGRLAVSAPQEWLVLAFALGCGVYAAWLRARGLSKRAESAEH